MQNPCLTTKFFWIFRTIVCICKSRFKNIQSYLIYPIHQHHWITTITTVLFTPWWRHFPAARPAWWHRRSRVRYREWGWRSSRSTLLRSWKSHHHPTLHVQYRTRFRPDRYERGRERVSRPIAKTTKVETTIWGYIYIFVFFHHWNDRTAVEWYFLW